MPRPKTLLLVPCDAHGDGPCPSRKGCANRRARAGLPPAKSGPTGNERRQRAKPEGARAAKLRAKLEAIDAKRARLVKLLDVVAELEKRLDAGIGAPAKAGVEGT